MSFLGMLESTGELRHPENTYNARREVVRGWSDPTTIRLSFQPKSGQGTTQEDEGVVQEIDAMCFCEASVDVRPEDGDGNRDKLTVDGVDYYVYKVEDITNRARIKRFSVKRFT